MRLNQTSSSMSSDAEVSVYTRIAASNLGATTMDRPEWVAVHPTKIEACCSLTNNVDRGVKPNKGGNPMPIDKVNPRAENKYGQIIRWFPDYQNHSSDGFYWEHFAVAGNPITKEGVYKGSKNITENNMFNSPDGLQYDTKGRLWISTDGDYSNQGDFKGQGNNQVLVGDPISGEIKRFMVGPRECEISGVTWSDDGKTLFVGIQHPGEKGNSTFPNGIGNIPRSTVVAISRKDGKRIG